MANDAIVGNIGHFDKEFHMADRGVLRHQGSKHQAAIGSDRCVFQDGDGIIILASGRLLKPLATNLS